MTKKLTAKEARELTIKSLRCVPSSRLVGLVTGYMLNKIRQEAAHGNTECSFLCRSLRGMANLSYNERVATMIQVVNRLEDSTFRCSLIRYDKEGYGLTALVEWWRND